MKIVSTRPPLWRRALAALGQRLLAFPGFAYVCHRAALVDRRLLSRSTKQEQGVHTALGLLVILAALWGGIGMAVKIGRVIGAGMLTHVGMFLFFAMLTWAIEASLIGGIKSGKRWGGLLAYRIVLGAVLVAMQVLPLLTEAFNARISQELHVRTLTQMAAAQDVVAKARNMGGVKSTATAAAQGASAARALADNPPETADIKAANEKVKNAAAALQKAQQAEEHARSMLARARAVAADSSLAEKRREAAQEGVKLWASRLEQRKAALSKADGVLEQAKGEQALLVTEQRNRLRGDAETALERQRDADEALKATEQRMEQDLKAAEELARKANSRSFFVEMGVLMRIAAQDFGVLFGCLVTLMVAALIDWLPVLTKIQMADGGYARAVAAREQRRIDGEETELHLDRVANENRRMVASNESLGLQRFTHQDQGGLASQRHAFAAQRELDAMRLVAEQDLMGEALRRISVNFDAVEALASRTKSNPALAPMLQAELRRLQERLDRLAAAPGAA